ncbi:N-acetylneuraminate synthase [Geobacter sp. AOG1]|uniref:N-acetylneuraminate synthase n=1 Tax=Geobacter sp. AOG1 TaxID=1566346 RepID=UPI001CC6BA5C|nr:N-acetylneuraminate synthase [Geobacter sp. AOG1]GFE58475.1 N-acetylneuraminate synthase [Geobacter sp. AOG1]
MVYHSLSQINNDMHRPVYIIAEAGVNHNGDLNLAKKLVDAAKAAGADCVKFQTFKTEDIVTASAPKATYQLKVTDRSESQLQMLKKLELDFDAHLELINYCRKIDIEFLSTPYSMTDIKLLEKLGVSSYKIASGQIVEPLFLRAVAATGKPIFLSTGMATLAEVDDAVRTIRAAGNGRMVLLQCTTDYPSRLEDANLRTIQTMAAAFGTVMGYSDHTQSDTACLVAIGLGAKVIEKHLTLGKNLAGPDHAASATPEEFARLCRAIREAELTLGSGNKEPCEAEILNARGMRRSLVATRLIKTGEMIQEDMLTCKRPGTGIRPGLMSEVIGCIATKDIQPDELIHWSVCGERK